MSKNDIIILKTCKRTSQIKYEKKLCYASMKQLEMMKKRKNDRFNKFGSFIQEKLDLKKKCENQSNDENNQNVNIIQFKFEFNF